MTYNEQEARVEPRTQEEWLDLILEDGSQYWGEDITERDGTYIHRLYEPFAGRLAELEDELQSVHEALRVRTAEGLELDYLGERLGVTRRPKRKSQGVEKFTRDTKATKDYLIQQGTVVETTGSDSIEFVTTEGGTIEGPTTEEDSSSYSTTNTSFTVKNTLSFDATYRASIDVDADFRTTNSSYTASIEIVDATNSNVIASASTTNTTFTAVGSTSYDVSSLSGTVDIEYRIKISNSSGSAEAQNFYLKKGGEDGVEVSIEAREAGNKGNVAANTITDAPSSITGVDSLTNPKQTSGGRNIEEDEAYRERIITSVGEIEVTSGQQIFNELSQLAYVKQVRYIDNSSDSSSDGLNAHEVELVIDAEPGHQNEIAQIIFNNIAMGANLVNGIHGSAASGTATLSNGQSFTIPFSVPTDVEIYVDADVTLESAVNKEEIKNAIVEYIGGVRTNGQQVYGDLNVGEDVLYGEVSFSIRNVAGVYDVTTLEVDTTSPPSGTSNIGITASQRATIDASNITINTTVK